MSGDTEKKIRNLDDFSGMASDWFWETDADHRFCYFSRRMQEVTKYDISTLLGKRRDTVPNEDLSDPKWVQHRDDLANHRPFRNFEYQSRSAEGELLWIRIAGEPQFDSNGVFTGYHGTGLNITEEKQAMQRLEDANAALATRNAELAKAKETIEKIAFTDALTGLRNRHAFERDIAQLLATGTGKIGLLHMDLDRFKWVNDTLGHPAGDKVLTEAAERINAVCHAKGHVYRIGGDEFTVVLADLVSSETALALGEAIVDTLKAPIQYGQQQASVGVSVGVAVADKGETDALDLTFNADTALYDAKRSGRSAVRLCTPLLQATLDEDRRLALDMVDGIDRREFIPFFQPQVDTSTNRVIGAEALVRWKHPKRGLLGPGAFLHIATELGKIEDIDRLILKDALAAVNRFAATGMHLPAISVNVSEARLVDPKLCSDIAQLWTNRRCQLTIELLETICFDEANLPLKFSHDLQHLRQMGVRLETDDFGSGRASIASLLHVLPDGLKIDRMLIQKVETSPQHRGVVQGILSIAEALDMDCLAEGVETQANIDTLVGLGCTRFQGYAISHPLPEEDFVAFLVASGDEDTGDPPAMTTLVS